MGRGGAFSGGRWLNEAIILLFKLYADGGDVFAMYKSSDKHEDLKMGGWIYFIFFSR